MKVLRDETIGEHRFTLSIVSDQYFLRKTRIDDDQLVIEAESRNVKKAYTNFNRWINEAEMLQKLREYK